MKFADRLKFTTTGTNAASFNDGTAVAGCRNIARVIADGGPIAIGDTNVPFTTDDGAGNWEDSLYTVGGTTSAPTLTRTQVLASSAGGTTAATFTGSPLTVFNTVPGKILSRVAIDSDVAFSQSVPLAQPGTAWMPQQTVSGALNFTPAANAIKGAYAYVRLVADGINVPTFSGFTEEIGSAGYDNRNGIVNRIQFSYDGSDYWVAVSQALNAAAVASALTLSLNSSSTAVGSPVTVTVGANVALTGSQSVSVTLTAPVAGTWSTNPVTLDATHQTATPTFTPSATGSGNITAAATGTPTLSGASTAYTATAAATVPGAPTIGTATAGDTTASFAFTAPASNGGAAITGYTLTVYKASDNSTVGTFSGVSSPINATGLTNGTGYYGKVAATNSVGTGAQSGASNTVTPAVSTAYTRLSQLSSLSETGTGPYGYTSTANGGFGTKGGMCTTHLQSGVDGSFGVTNDNIVEFISAVTSSSTMVTFSNAAVLAGVYANGSGGNYQLITNGSLGTVTGTARQAGDAMLHSRSGSTLTISVTRSGGGAPITLGTWNVGTGVLYFEVNLNSSGTMSNLTSSGLA